jgi:DNA-binding NtrC family response regulator
MSQYFFQVNVPFDWTTERSAKPPERVPVLSVSPVEEDHHSLERLLCCEKWTVHKVSNVTVAVEALWCNVIPVVVCNSDLRPGMWREVLTQIQELPMPPSVIVASRRADERLWAEVLNLGAYDVLAKPLVAIEVARVLKSAWLRWRNENESAINFSRVMAAGVSA